MNTTEIKKYETMKELFDKGKISETTWQKYCTKVLEKLMKENKKVLEYLK